jgi:hypothetical protein
LLVVADLAIFAAVAYDHDEVPTLVGRHPQLQECHASRIVGADVLDEFARFVARLGPHEFRVVNPLRVVVLFPMELLE